MIDTEAPEPTAVVEETAPPAEVPAAPETVAPSAPADEAATTEPAASLATRPRGPDGRFIKADGTQASEAEHAAIEASAPPTSPPLAATTPQPPAPPTPSTEPITFRGGGQRHQIPGSSVTPEGNWVIPANQTQVLRGLLAEGVEYRTGWRQREADYKRQITEAGAVQEARAEKYNAAAVYLFDIITDPSKLQALIESPERVGLLQERVALMLEQYDLKAPRKTEQPAPDPVQQQQQLHAAAQRTLAEYVDELLETPQARSVYATEEDRQAVRARYNRRLAAYFVERDGDTLLSEVAVDEDFQDELQSRITARKAADEQVAALARAKAANDQRNAKPVVPSVVPAKGSPTPSDAGKPKDKVQWAREHGFA